MLYCIRYYYLCVHVDICKLVYILIFIHADSEVYVYKWMSLGCTNVETCKCMTYFVNVYLSNVISWLGVHIFFGLSSNATSSSSFNMIVPDVVF